MSHQPKLDLNKKINNLISDMKNSKSLIEFEFARAKFSGWLEGVADTCELIDLDNLKKILQSLNSN